MLKPEVLYSIVDLTSNKDTDSLEISLLMTLSELMPNDVFRLYRCEVSDGRFRSCLMRLGFAKNADNPGGEWRSNVKVANPENELSLACLSLRTAQSGNNAARLYWLPQRINEREVACLCVGHETLTEEQEMLLKGFLKIYINYTAIIDQSEKDKLTGLLNRSSLERRFRGLLEKQGSRNPLGKGVTYSSGALHEAWLGLVDIDHFKSVNDTYGHLCGDEVLLTLSQYMKEAFTENELLFRYGGEEFLIVLEPTSVEHATAKFESFRELVSTKSFPLVGSITLSIGFTNANPNEYFQNVIERADKALYFAKQNGRNMCCHYEVLVEQGELDTAKASGDVDLF